jgi:hypothetical protein
MSVRQIAKGVGLVFVAGLAPQLPMILRGPPNTSWAVALLGLAAAGLTIGVAIRQIMIVRVSADGLRGIGSRVLKWNDMTEAQSARLFGGFVVRSKYRPSIQVPRSVAARDDFQEHVREVAPPDNPVVSFLATA